MQFQPASFFSLSVSSLSRVSQRAARLRPVVAILMLALVVSACSRQADGPFEPVDGSTPTTAVTSVSQIVDATEEAGSLDGLTPTFAPLPTEDTGTEVNLDGGEDETSTTDTEDESGDTDAPLIFTLPPSQTPDVEDNGMLDPLATEEASASPEGVFITPGVPSGPIDLTGGAGTVGGIPGAAGTPGTGAGDLLPTPTDLLDFGGTDAAEVDEECIYVVQRGDSLFGIALDLEVSLADLRAVNPEIQETDFIQINQELIIPDCGDNVVADDDEDEISTPAGGATPLPPPGRATATTQPETGRTHEVAAGETLFIIAQRYGVTIDAIVAANSLANPNRLAVGQILIIPDAD